jgi:hypothetical protein
MYTNGNNLGTYTVGELGFGIKSIAKSVRKVVKKVPGVKLVGKIGEKVLKPIAKPLRPVVARIAPIASGGLIKPKLLGIKAAKSQAAYRQVGKIVRTVAMPTLAVHRAVLKKVTTPKASAAVTQERLIPISPIERVGVPLVMPPEAQPTAPSLLPSAPESGWTGGGGGGGGEAAAGGGTEPSPEPEQPPPSEETTAPTQAGMTPGLTFVLLSGAFYMAYKLTQPKRARRR